MVAIEVGGDRSFIHPPPYPLLKVFTGRVPFSGTGAPAVMRCIMTGRRPGRPDHPGFTEQLWALTQRCWDGEARGRPEIQEVVKALGEPSPFNQASECHVRYDHLFASPMARNVSHQCCKYPEIELTLNSFGCQIMNSKPGVDLAACHRRMVKGSRPLRYTRINHIFHWS